MAIRLQTEEGKAILTVFRRSGVSCKSTYPKTCKEIGRMFGGGRRLNGVGNNDMSCLYVNGWHALEMTIVIFPNKVSSKTGNTKCVRFKTKIYFPEENPG